PWQDPSVKRRDSAVLICSFLAAPPDPVDNKEGGREGSGTFSPSSSSCRARAYSSLYAQRTMKKVCLGPKLSIKVI
ncbi:hypothetical protein GBAR_LOCUS5154, partial [Geodia barretti]